jgi:hypothetical protein
MNDTSWWVEAQFGPRERFFAALTHQVARLRLLTHRPELQARGREEKSKVKGGKTPALWDGD